MTTEPTKRLVKIYIEKERNWHSLGLNFLQSTLFSPSLHMCASFTSNIDNGDLFQLYYFLFAILKHFIQKEGKWHEKYALDFS